jgi:peptide/nickel transport system ATP-binding protein
VTDPLTVTDLKVEFRLNEAVIRAVDGVSFRIPEGGTVALVGESGSGKSVISQAIMGILPPPATITGGQILFRDPRAPGTVVDIVALDTESRQMRAIRGGRISIIFQEPMTSLSPLHTVGDQVGEALHLHREVSAAEGRELTEQILALVGFPDSERALRTYPFELSGGLRQRAMIAMALVCRPALLIADEPTTALDVTIQAQILKLIKDLQAELGMAVLMITHDLGVVANIADEIVVLYNGEVMESGMLQEVYRNPGHYYFRALLRAVPRFNMAEGERLMPLREIEHHTGHLLAKREDGPDAGTGTLLEVRGLSKRFQLRKSGFFGGGDNEIVAVDNVSFSVDRGRCFGIVGESGSGKTTVSKLVTRALDPDSGDIIFFDEGRAVDLVALSDRGLLPYRRKIQFIFQDPFSSLNPRMTVFDLISEPLLVHAIGDAVYRAELVQELMALVGLDPRFLNRYPHSFSGGQRQRIGIARALALRPALLICDEPVSALDVSVQAQILNLLKDLQEQLGLTYIFISHNLAVVDYIADEIAVMCAGRIVERAPRQALFRSPTHPYTKALLAAVPEPDPDARLDFSALMEGRAFNPAAWPDPFTLDRRGGDGDQHAMFDLGGGHFVYARTDAKREEVVG